MPHKDASAPVLDASAADDPALLSPSDASPTTHPSWPRPRTPIPPHRLAKLANALGISTPIPISQSPSDSLTSTSLPKPSSLDSAWRSPTPSVTSTPHLTAHSPASSQSKFLLHVIPPLLLPHDSDSSEALDITPPPPAASGYHTQFRRGTLVPLFPTLQNQLWAIAKEYALPSTAGMILYLVSAAPSPTTEQEWSAPDEPGPRLSEDIWKHLWTRVVRFEAERIHGRPRPILSVLALVTADAPRRWNPHIHPTLFGHWFSWSHYSSPFTPTASSGSSNPPTQSTSSEPSNSDVDTPDTSLPPDSRAATLDLPGLTSQSIIPILAKVEFDIDERKAPCEVEAIRVAPVPLKLVDRQAVPRFLLSADDERENGQDAGYARLSESPADLDDAEFDGADASASVAKQDPLSDVFGADDETWADVRASNADQRTKVVDPDVVELALDGQALSEPLDVSDEVGVEDNIDEQEVQELWESRARPQLTLDIPPSPPPDGKRRSSPTTAGTVTAGTFRKTAPPPLTLMPAPSDVIATAEPSPLPMSDGVKLAYLRDGMPTSSEEDLNESAEDDSVISYDRNKSPIEDKRVGTFFEDLDLGLEFDDAGEFDENDPNDRRRSQYVLKAKLDEIEKALVQFSPRLLEHELKPYESPIKSPPRSSSLAMNSLTPQSALSPSLSANVSLGSPPRKQGGNDPMAKANAVWPAVPYSSLNRQEDEDLDTSIGLDDFPAPPKLALNGVSNAIPISPYKRSFSVTHDVESEESKARKREMEGHEPTYPDIVPPSLRKLASSNSPIIPLSPDPQAAKITYSTFEIPPERHSSLSSLSRNDSITGATDTVSTAPSSRFSIDSSDGGGSNRGGASLNPVRSIRSLWRKSRKSSISAGSGSASPQPPSGRTSPQPPPVPNVPGPSTPRSNTPTAVESPRDAAPSPMLSPERQPPRGQHPDSPFLSTSQAQQRARGESSINSIVFDQESPYPVRRSPQPPAPAPRTRTPSQAARSPPTRHSLARDASEHTAPSSPAESSSLDALPSPPGSLAERDKAGTRKSILKAWRTPPGETSGRTSVDARPTEPLRKRRPSVIELVRGSISGAPTMGDIPPSPLLPEQYAAGAGAGAQPRARATPSSSFESARAMSAAGSPPRPVRGAGTFSMLSQEGEEVDLR
ncbi:hypothetical protein BC834DRAFT_1037547 [Gloeopeniophorella convolvens]|nr:hypothetical protein BC834DRAFT_1037547 [Gloeopeniophorella convolvens]